MKKINGCRMLNKVKRINRERCASLSLTTAGMQEIEQRRERLPTTAWMQEIEQRRERLPSILR